MNLECNFYPIKLSNIPVDKMKIDISESLIQAAEIFSAEYKVAISKGDLENALINVQKCIFIFGKLADRSPYNPQSYQKKAKEWKLIELSLHEQILHKTSSSTSKISEYEKNISPDIIEINDQFWHDLILGNSDILIPVIDTVFHIALEIAREGREGRHVGTAFLIGDVDNVLKHSKQLILNPFQGHKDEDRSITNPDMKECVKELAQLDGAFIVRGDGIVEAAARYITIDTSKVNIPPGHGTRHSSIAAITQETKSIGIIVSQSGGKISLIKEGKIFKTIHP
jgi:DNA integrity scanning protein DisA with diadenylate cyclase activity